MMGFRFQDPLWLLLLLLIPAIRLVERCGAGRRPCSIRTSTFSRTLPQTAASASGVCCPGSPWPAWRCWRSRWPGRSCGKEEFRVRAEGIAIEMCIDRSGSMQAMDFEIDGEPVNAIGDRQEGVSPVRRRRRRLERPARRSDRAGRFRRLCRGEDRNSKDVVRP